jgi:glucose dehydrogenase
VKQFSTEANGEDNNTTNICPAALGSKDQAPSSYDPNTGLIYVPTNHVCMDYEPYKVSYQAGQAYVGATYIAVLSGVGGWAGIGLAAGLVEPDKAMAWHAAVDQTKTPTVQSQAVIDTAGLGAVGAYKALSQYTQLGGVLTVFTVEQ